ncbi:MAG: serine hydrolase [Lachnospiraceae bacterium]|nr:serine hydrolase [Lachnospiraceae bacterium]
MLKNKVFAVVLSLILVFGVTGCDIAGLGEDKAENYFENSFKKYSPKKIVTYQPPVDISETSIAPFSKDLCVISPKDVKSTDPLLNAASTLIFDQTSKEVLYANGIYDKLYPASVTKIVSALVAYKYGNPDDIVTFSYAASHITEPGAKLCGFMEGDKIRLGDLIECMLIYSGNDAAQAIAEHIGGSVEGFADMMNRECKELGATHSNFVNPHGLHNENHYTTTYDMYIVFQELLKNDAFVETVHKSSYVAVYTNALGETVDKTFETTNRFLLGTMSSPEGVTVIGGKTGTTGLAGSCLILYSKGADNHDYVSVVFKADNADDLYNQMFHLMEFER